MMPLVRTCRLVSRGFLALLIGLAGGTAARAGGLQTDLAAYYHLDGNGLDASGNGLNLSLVGNPSFGTGLFGEALSLQGNDSQYATRPGDDAALNFGSSDFAIQVWVNFNQFGGRLEQTLIEKFSGQAGPGWTLTTPHGDSLLFFGIGIPNVSAPISFTPDT